MYSTRIRVHARLPNGHPCEEKRSRTKVRRILTADFVGELNGPRAPRQSACRARRADFHALILARKSARKSVSVSVSVSVLWNLTISRSEVILFKGYCTVMRDTHTDRTDCCTCITKVARYIALALKGRQSRHSHVT